MLFADDLVSFGIGSGAVAILGLIGGGVAWILKWGRDGKTADDARDDKDEETALHRLQKVMELREADCNKRIQELTQRVENLERHRDAKQVERDAYRDRTITQAARIKYLEMVLRREKITPDLWDQPGSADTLPSLDVTPPSGDK